MIRQIRYFQSVVQNQSFSKAAEACHISQSAISQQIKALENELGFLLLERKNRSFTLTKAGQYFYQKSLILVSDLEQICAQARKLADTNDTILQIGYLRSFAGSQLTKAVDLFQQKYPEIPIELFPGDHEELFQKLRTNQVDLVFSDQRRAFSDDYINVSIVRLPMFIEISLHDPIASLKEIQIMDLKNLPCILVCTQEQEQIEREYYHSVLGFPCEFIFARDLEQAHLMVISQRGFFPYEAKDEPAWGNDLVAHIPLIHDRSRLERRFCLFWKKDLGHEKFQAFSQILHDQCV